MPQRGHSGPGDGDTPSQWSVVLPQNPYGEQQVPCGHTAPDSLFQPHLYVGPVASGCDVAPQSVSDSSPFMTPSLHTALEQMLPRHTLDEQS